MGRVPAAFSSDSPGPKSRPNAYAPGPHLPEVLGETTGPQPSKMQSLWQDGGEFPQQMIRGWDPVAVGNRAGAGSPEFCGESSPMACHTAQKRAAPLRTQPLENAVIISR